MANCTRSDVNRVTQSSFSGSSLRSVVEIGRCVIVGTGLLLCSAFFESSAVGEEYVELVVPLKDGRRYSVRNFYQEINQKLGGHYDLSSVPANKENELSPFERALLLAASEADLIRARVESNELILRIPNSENDVIRRANRRRLEHLLGIGLDEWPRGRGLHLPANFQSTARTILLVHGLESHTAELRRFAQACEHWGIQPILFDYPNDGPLAWSGRRLSDELKALAHKFPKLRVVVVAHSMGGLVSRHCLEMPDLNPGCVSHLFTLGTPHQGTALSEIQPLMELVYESLSHRGERWCTLRDGLGEAADDLRPNSAFLVKLNDQAIPKDVTYHVAAGRKSLLDKSHREAVEQAIGDRSPAWRLKFLSVLRAPELQDGLGDGAVTVESALLKKISDRNTFDLNHLELLSLPGDRPEDCAVFHWIVETLDWTKP